MVRISGTEGHEQQTSATERMPAIARRPTTAGTLTKTGTLQRQMYQQHWGVEACKSRFAIKKARDTYNGKDALNIEDISTSRTPGTVQRHTTYIVKPERKKQEENQQQHGYQQEQRQQKQQGSKQQQGCWQQHRSARKSMQKHLQNLGQHQQQRRQNSQDASELRILAAVIEKMVKRPKKYRKEFKITHLFLIHFTRNDIDRNVRSLMLFIASQMIKVLLLYQSDSLIVTTSVFYKFV